MIIIADRKLEIGSVVTNLIYKDPTGKIHRGHPFFVMREATKEEWLADFDSDADDQEGKASRAGMVHFYEVHTD